MIMKGTEQFEVEVVGYTSDTFEEITFRSDIIVNAVDMIDAMSFCTKIFADKYIKVTAAVNLERARNRMCTFRKNDID